jgi:nucleotide-binding universal stress UspA family protein
MQIKRQEPFTIMVAIDFSKSLELALAYALRIAEPLKARLYLVHICHPAPPGETRQVIAGELTLEALRQKVAERAPVESHLRAGEAVPGLLQVIREVMPDLVIAGSHGHGAIHRVLLGSVAERLSRESPVPVMVVPAPERTHVP